MAFITTNQSDPTQSIVKGVPRPPQPSMRGPVKPDDMSDEDWNPQVQAASANQSSLPVMGMAPAQTVSAAPAAQGSGTSVPKQTSAAPTAQKQTLSTTSQGQPPSVSLNLDEVEDESVQSRAAAITATNSPLMKQARSSGMRSANARGLLNSSIAVGASEDAAYRVAAPMASQEAAQAAARNQTRLQVSGRLRELATQAGYDKEARAENFGYQTKLNDQTFGHQSQLQAQGFQQTQQLNQAQYAEERARLERQLENANLQQRTEIEARVNMLDREFQNQSKLSGQQFGQQQQLATQQFGFQKELQTQQNNFSTEMAKLQQGYAVDNAKLQASLQSALQAQANTETLGRMAVEFENQAKLSLQQHGQQLEAIKASGDQDVRRQAMMIEASMQELTLNLNQRNTEAAVTAAMNLFNAEAQIRAAIMANDTMPAAERQAYMNAVGGLSAPVRDFINQALGAGAPAGGSTSPAPATGMAPLPAGATTASGYTADGQPIYRDPIPGGGYTIGGMNPYVNWQ